jgi:tetratricopeptide (TPR) repeat protein
MTVPAKAQCACGSGLRPARCCKLDLQRLPAPDASLRPQVEQALVAHDLGRIDESTRLCVKVLEQSPSQPGAVALLLAIRKAEGKMAAVESLARRLVALDPNNLAATEELALALFNRGDLAEAERHARNAVRLAPQDAQAHNLMGMIMTEANRPQVGEHHYREAMRLIAQPSPILSANLAWNLKNQGRMDEARALYERSVALDPAILQTLMGWARMEETDRNFARAGALLDQAERLAPDHPTVLLFRAITHGRTRDYGAALAALERIARRQDGGLGPAELVEQGQLLDKMGRYDEAFAAFDTAKRRLRELSHHAYLADAAGEQAARLKGFFQAHRLKILPRAGVRTDCAQPIFVVGFPRSGTTMVEQTLSAHPRIAAGDELPLINDLTELMPRMLNSPLAYPEALADLWMGDQRDGLDNLRDHYLQRARQIGVMPPGAAWFTDKMPLNETHLGLIGLIFPAAPIVHVLRHPLDVVLSAFSNLLTHGFYCAYALESAARHYLLVMDLVEHYRREMTLRYLPVRYEDIVDDQAPHVRRMLEFVGAEFDPRCLSFHENRRYARTASYAQVTERLYDRSRYRYRNYLEQLAPVIPLLAPAIAKLGYRVD